MGKVFSSSLLFFDNATVFFFPIFLLFAFFYFFVFCFMLHHHIIWLTALRYKLPHFRNNNANYSHYCTSTHSSTTICIYSYSSTHFRFYALVTFCTSYCYCYCCTEIPNARSHKKISFISLGLFLLFCYWCMVMMMTIIIKGLVQCKISCCMITLHGRQTNAFASRKSKWSIERMEGGIGWAVCFNTTRNQLDDMMMEKSQLLQIVATQITSFSFISYSFRFFFCLFHFLFIHFVSLRFNSTEPHSWLLSRSQVVCVRID